MKISLRGGLIFLIYSEVEWMLGSIPYAKTRKTSLKLSVDLWLKDILELSQKRETSICVFISVVQLVQLILLLWLK